MTTPAIRDLEHQLEQARAEIPIAEEAERQAYERVSAAREGHALGQLARRAILPIQRSLAAAQENSEVAKAHVRAIERLLAEERDRDDRERAATLAEKRAEIAAAAAELGARMSELCQSTLAELDELEVEYAELNGNAGGIVLARQRPPSDYPRVHGALTDALDQFARLYEQPKPRAGESHV